MTMPMTHMPKIDHAARPAATVDLHVAIPGWAQRWLGWGLWWLLVGMAISPVGHKVWNPGEPYHYSLLALFVPPALWLVWRRRRQALHLLTHSVEGVLLLLFLSWAAVTVAWANHGHLGDALIIELWVLLFVTTWGLVLAAQPQRGRRLLFWAGLGLAASALVSLAAFPLRSLVWQDRLVAFGTLNNPNLAGFAMGAALVWMTQLSVRKRGLRILHVSAVLVLALFVLLTFSRAAWLAVLVSQGLMILWSQRRRLRRRAGLLLCVAVAAIALGGSKYMEQRGFSYRPQIFEQACQLIRAHPLLGLGLGSEYEIHVDGQVWEHSHNVFTHLTILLGLPGGVLWLAIWLAVGWRAWRYRHVALGRSLLALWIYATVAWQFDAPFLLQKPDVEWLLGWLPLAVSLGLAWRVRDAKRETVVQFPS